MEKEIEVGSKVITSKGRFGIVEFIVNHKAIVKIGAKTHEIYISELLLCDNAKSIELEYYCGGFSPFDKPEKDIVHISKKLTAYDFQNPLENKLLEACKEKLVKRVNNNNVVITKINLI